MVLTNREVAILGILLLCVPFQFWLSNISYSTPHEKSLKVREFILEAKYQLQTIFSLKYWIQCLKEIIRFSFSKDKNSKYYGEDSNPLGECPAVEVIKFWNPEGYFSTSPIPRDVREQIVKFRVGQVVWNKKHKYFGVIIGWDRTAKAPRKWIEENHQDNLEWQYQPNYAILVHTQDRSIQQTTYVAQENLEMVKVKVTHSEIDDYFDGYDGAQYLSQPWLQAIYPLD